MPLNDQILIFSQAPHLSAGRDLDLIQAFQHEHGPILPGLWDAAIQHDDHCPRLANAAPCICDVEITLTNLQDGQQFHLKWAPEAFH